VCKKPPLLGHVALAAAHDGGGVPLTALLLHALPARTFVRQHHR
jgi:hypothetical protein